jgi:hypothetical protein
MADKKPIPTLKLDNQELLKALTALREDRSKENSHKLTNRLVAPTTLFLLPLAAEGNGVMMLNASDGNLFLPAYTSGDEVKKAPNLTAKSRIAAVDIARYGAMLEHDEKISGIVIDPQGINFVLRRETVLNLKAVRESNDKLPKGPIRILTPKEGFSNDMTKAVGQALYKVKEVDSCFLRIAERGEGEETMRNWLFVVEYYGEEFTDLVKIISEACKPYVAPDARIEVCRYDSELGQQVTQQGDPFFRRQMLWY